MKNYQTSYNNKIYFLDNKLISDNLTITFPKSILNKERIINKEKFIDYYLKYFRKNHLSKMFFLKSITIIYDNEISKNDIEVIKNTFMDLNYRKIILKSDKSLLDLNKKSCFIIKCSDLKLYYIDKYNNKRKVIIDCNEYSQKEIINMFIPRIKNKDIYLINYDINLPDDFNYYILPNKEKYFIKLI